MARQEADRTALAGAMPTTVVPTMGATEVTAAAAVVAAAAAATVVAAPRATRGAGLPAERGGQPRPMHKAMRLRGAVSLSGSPGRGLREPAQLVC